MEALRERAPGWSEEKLRGDIRALLEEKKAGEVKRVRQWVSKMTGLLRGLERELLM